MEKFKEFLAKEAGIEFKACLYFFVILFYYVVYKLLGGSMEANIIYMAEMILSTYIMGYIQVYLLRNFDEADRIGLYEIGGALLCTLVYAGESYLLNWFEKNVWVSVLFGGYMLYAFWCAYLVYKVKREVETKLLNEELKDFKKNRYSEMHVTEDESKET